MELRTAKYLWLAMSMVSMLTLTTTARAADVRYISGGIGTDECEALHAKEGEYNIKVVTAAESGNYLSSVMVVIESSKHEPILETTMTGPILLAKLRRPAHTRLRQTVTVEAERLMRRRFLVGLVLVTNQSMTNGYEGAATALCIRRHNVNTSRNRQLLISRIRAQCQRHVLD